MVEIPWDDILPNFSLEGMVGFYLNLSLRGDACVIRATSADLYQQINRRLPEGWCLRGNTFRGPEGEYKDICSRIRRAVEGCVISI